jgi:hypothetical protein
MWGGGESKEYTPECPAVNDVHNLHTENDGMAPANSF